MGPLLIICDHTRPWLGHHMWQVKWKRVVDWFKKKKKFVVQNNLLQGDPKHSYLLARLGAAGLGDWG